MSKELKALEKINHTICLAFNDDNKVLFNKDSETHIDCKDIYEFIDCYNIIETALKDYENLKTINNALKDKNIELCQERVKYEKKLKAFEIIKREIDIIGLIEDGINLNAIEITKEEYDLLREVLL